MGLFSSGFNVNKVREDFPFISNNKDAIYFDNACMSLKPKQVIDKMLEYYTLYTACGGRSHHKFSERVNEEVEKARLEVKKLINARSEKEIIFTKNTTESINLVAKSLGLRKGDEVIITDKEHNSNLLPWLRLNKDKGIIVKIMVSNQDNTFNIENFKRALTKNTKLVSVHHRSNLDGVTNPIEEISKLTHRNGSLLLVDAAQSVPSMEIDVKKLNIDFIAFSGHKMLAPTGVGVLYGKLELLSKLSPFILGGETVSDSSYDSYTLKEVPHRFEAGLQNYAGIIGFGEAIRYLKKVGFNNIEKQEAALNKLVTERLMNNSKIELIGPKDYKLRGNIFSFNIKGMEPHNVSSILNSSANIAVRSGAHCVHSWFNKHKLKGSVRASLYFYNTEEEALKFAEEVERIAGMV
ncbi:cysteine desulfurase [Candidatus Pacearchaeota archaeon]|nr:cysteine desulfurase [Candidatus Pacearchaeota archaeon]